MHISLTLIVPGPVFNLMADGRFTSVKSVVLNWGFPQMPKGVIISYEVTYRVGSGEPVTTNTTELTFTISDLEPATTVSGISVRAFTSAGGGILTIHPDVVIPANPHPRELAMPHTVNPQIFIVH